MDRHAIHEIMAEPHPLDSLKPADVASDDRAYTFSEQDEKLVMDNLRVPWLHVIKRSPKSRIVQSTFETLSLRGSEVCRNEP